MPAYMKYFVCEFFYSRAMWKLYLASNWKFGKRSACVSISVDLSIELLQVMSRP